MKCPKVKAYLHLYLDSELSPETTFEIAQHLDECEPCRALASGEQRLESLLRERLVQSAPDDSQMWGRAVRQAIPINRFAASLSTRVIYGLAAVLVLSAGAILWSRYFSHGELDLAEAVANAHTEVIEDSKHTFAVTGESSRVDSFFREQLSARFDMNLSGLDNCRSLEGSICDVQGVKTAHIVCDADTSVSLFWMSASDLSAFPAALARFEKEGPYIHCTVQPYEFCAFRDHGAVIVGIGSVPETQLRSILERLSLSGES